MQTELAKKVAAGKEISFFLCPTGSSPQQILDIFNDLLKKNRRFASGLSQSREYSRYRKPHVSTPEIIQRIALDTSINLPNSAPKRNENAVHTRLQTARDPKPEERLARPEPSAWQLKKNTTKYFSLNLTGSSSQTRKPGHDHVKKRESDEGNVKVRPEKGKEKEKELGVERLNVSSDETQDKRQSSNRRDQSLEQPMIYPESSEQKNRSSGKREEKRSKSKSKSPRKPPEIKSPRPGKIAKSDDTDSLSLSMSKAKGKEANGKENMAHFEERAGYGHIICLIDHDRSNLQMNVILHFHGGGFVAGSPHFHESYLRDWAHRTKALVVSVYV